MVRAAARRAHRLHKACCYSVAQYAAGASWAARRLAALVNVPRVRSAGLRAIRAVVASWELPQQPRARLLADHGARRTTVESWSRLLLPLRNEMRTARVLADLEQDLLSTEELGDLLREPLNQPAAAPQPTIGTSSSSPLPQETIQYMRAALRASAGLPPDHPPPALRGDDASPSAAAPSPQQRGRAAVAQSKRPRLHIDHVIESQKACALARLRCDESAGALHFSDAQADWFAAELGAAELAGVNRDTARRDDAWWRKYWIPITSTLDTTPIRNFPQAVTGTDMALRFRETTLLVYVLIMILTMMQPRRRGAPAPKVSSALHVLLGVRRVHSRMGIEMVPFRLIRDSISNLTMRFVELHGHEALLPQRKAPLSFDAFQALILLPPGVYGSVHYTGLLAT